MSGAVNPERGETVLLVDGAPVRLCLTLGALATLEAAFGADALEERLRKVSAEDLLVLVSALSGDPALTPQALAGRAIHPAEAARAVAEAFRLAFA